MSLVLKTPPESLGEMMLQTLCDHLRHVADIGGSPDNDAPDDIDYIRDLADGAVAYIERRIRRSLLSQTWVLLLEDWPARCIRLPMTPVSDVSSVKYYDTAGVLQTLNASKYHVVDLATWDPAIRLAAGESWPDLASRPDAVTIEFVAGYGTTAEDVPPPIRQAIREVVAHWYENRQGVAFSTATEVPLTIAELLQPYRVYR